MKNHIQIITIAALGILLISATIDLNNLLNYENQNVPNYINKDNTEGNAITDEGATLGRVLFYDKRLSSNNTIACASCHQQEFAFSDTNLVSAGVNGVTGRHSMRLINARFATEAKFFWDERADSLEMQSTMPIQDHFEMGFSGTQGDPDFNDLLDKLDTVEYYNELFYLAFGDTVITEDRIQKAIAQFVRSIQSFDSKFDVGRAQANNDGAPFPNFTQSENAGKGLFLAPPQFNANGERIGGGAGCGGCHQAPEFDIDPNSLSNGVIRAVNSTDLDTLITRSPTLRDLFNPQGQLNGPLMHNGNFTSIEAAIQHYNAIPAFDQIPQLIPSVDPRLRPGGNPQRLNLTQQEADQLVDFLKTLTGSDVYTNEKWSDPFDVNGNLTLTGGVITSLPEPVEELEIKTFPDPVVNDLNIQGDLQNTVVELYNMNGQLLKRITPQSNNEPLSMQTYGAGIYLLTVSPTDGSKVVSMRIVKSSK